MDEQILLPASYDKNGIHYILHGDYYLPDFKLPNSEPYIPGKYGRMRLRFLEQHARAKYSILLTSGKLGEDLRETEDAARDAVSELTKTIAKQNGATETLKAQDQMRWVGIVNSAKACAEEMVLTEIICVF